MHANSFTFTVLTGMFGRPAAGFADATGTDVLKCEWMLSNICVFSDETKGQVPATKLISVLTLKSLSDIHPGHRDHFL